MKLVFFLAVKSGITKKRLIDPNVNEFKVVYKNMMKWLKNRVQKAREWYKKRDISKDVRPGMAVAETLRVKANIKDNCLKSQFNCACYVWLQKPIMCGFFFF